MHNLKYSKLLRLESFDERVDYLKLWNLPHTSPRAMSQSFYKSEDWLQTRDSIIKRDWGFDLGIFGLYIHGPVYVHHLNPINEDDIRKWSDKLFDPENLVSTSLQTHNLIHYKPDDLPYVERKPGDTRLWSKRYK